MTLLDVLISLLTEDSFPLVLTPKDTIAIAGESSNVGTFTYSFKLQSDIFEKTNASTNKKFLSI